MTELLNDVDQRRRNLRIILFIIILGTLPFYCAGFWLWGTAPQNNNGIQPTPTNDPFLTPSATLQLSPTNTLEASITPLPGLPTPIPITPPTAIFPPTATTPPIFIPTATTAPSLTPFPSATPFPTLTNTTIPLPTETPFPTFTPTLTPTLTETPTTIPIEFDTGGDDSVPSS